MPEKVVIISDKAPKPIGPYSAGIRFGHFVFTAGQIGIDRSAGKLVEGGVEAQARQAMTNLTYILAEAGTSLDNAVKTTIFLKDMADFAAVNAIYNEFFSGAFPARSTVQVAALPGGASVEIEVIAAIP